MGWLLVVQVIVVAVYVALRMWWRSERNCQWCKYERAVRMKGDRVFVPFEYHTCWKRRV